MAIFTITASKATPHKAIKYITNPEKATLVAGINVNKNGDVATQMMRTARLWGKGQNEKERKYYHFKFCFDPRDFKKNSDKLTKEKAMKVAVQILKERFGTTEGLLAVHEDTDEMHVHAILNAVDLMTGEKLDIRNKEYIEIKDRVQEICEENGLSGIDWRKAVKEKRARESEPETAKIETFAEKGLKERGKNTWKDELRSIIDASAKESRNMEQFKTALASKGVTLTRCTDTTISYKFGEHKACRGDTLGGDYTMQAIRSALKNNEKSVVEEVTDRKLESLINVANAEESIVSSQQRETYRKLGGEVGFKRSEVDELCDLRNCSWEEKQRVWEQYKRAVKEFWDEYYKRKQAIERELNNAYKMRKLMNFVNWAVDPRNQKKSLGSLIFALIVITVNPKIMDAEKEIENYKELIGDLRESSKEFKKTSGEARDTLKAKGLSLDEYVRNVKRMQDLAELLCDPVFNEKKRREVPER